VVNLLVAEYWLNRTRNRRGRRQVPPAGDRRPAAVAT
jgi:hypothetical protein